MLRRIALFIVSMAFFGSATAQDQKPPQDPGSLDIVALEVPWLLHEKMPGPYNKMVDELLLTYSEEMSVRVFPFKRAIRHFFEGNADCFFVGDYDEAYFRNTNMTRQSVIISDPFNTSSVRVFTREGAPPVNSIVDLYERRIAIDLGVGGRIGIQKFFPKLTSILESLNVAQAHAMLMQGRVDSIMIMDYDYKLFVARHPEKEPLTPSTDFQVGPVEDALMCKKSSRTLALIDHVNARITDLQQSGMLATLLRPDGR